MVAKKSGKALLREEGLERTDNNLPLTSWSQVTPINQKNYYTDYMKRDDQVLAYRLQNEKNREKMAENARNRDRALAQTSGGDVTVAEGHTETKADMGDATMLDEEDIEYSPRQVVVIHPGSQNLRIGLASDAVPRTIPMVIARLSHRNESEGDDAEPLPERLKGDDGAVLDAESMFGEKYPSQYKSTANLVRAHMKANKLRVVNNPYEVVISHNKRSLPQKIAEHNDPSRIEWTEVPAKDAPAYYTGEAALRIPDDSEPRYKLSWPLRHGWYNERDYPNWRLLREDIATILKDAITDTLRIKAKTRAQYGCVVIVPDLYERQYVISFLDMLLVEFGFGRVSFFQESAAATYGSGSAGACVVDLGAQKTSICCVDEGACVENSRINLKYGGYDVTEAFIKMLLYHHFPYADINLRRRYDFLLAEELKQRFCTVREMDVTVQLQEFYLRAPSLDTQKYSFKTYDEVILAPMVYFYTSMLDNLDEKLKGRRRLLGCSRDLYDDSPNDPMSEAQASVYDALAPKKKVKPLLASGTGAGDIANGGPSTPSMTRQQIQGSAERRNENPGNTPRSSIAGSPAPEAGGTPQPGTEPANQGPATTAERNAEKVAEKNALTEERDKILPVLPLDKAIWKSITHASESDERKARTFLSVIILVGGGAKIRGFPEFLEERLKENHPNFKKVTVYSPRAGMDHQNVTWKGGAVFCQLGVVDECWISALEYDRLGSRVLTYKCMWAW